MQVNQPLFGKTYSLFGQCGATDQFYVHVDRTIDMLRQEFSQSEEELLEFIQKTSKRRKIIRNHGNPGSAEDKLFHILEGRFMEYTSDIEHHLRTTPVLKKLTDPDLFTTREQYWLYMIEFELTNRVYREEFLNSRFKLALLPYCLKDSQLDCRAKTDSIDSICKGCGKDCFVNLVSVKLREHDIHPYVWSRTSLSTMFRNLLKEHGSVGVLGIACIVELVMGMRKVRKARLPVVGIPLNANRCIRWMESMLDTSVDLKALERLLMPDKK